MISLYPSRLKRGDDEDRKRDDLIYVLGRENMIRDSIELGDRTFVLILGLFASAVALCSCATGEEIITTPTPDIPTFVASPPTQNVTTQEFYPSISTILSTMYPDATVHMEKGIYLTKSLTRAEAQNLGLGCNAAEISPIFFSPYKQNGETRFIILNQIQGCENVCHACSPALAGATFAFTNGGWRLKTNQSFITNRIGEWGTIPEGSGTLVHVGPDRFAVALDVSYSQMGITYVYHYLIAEAGDQIRLIFSSKMSGENPFCEDPADCWKFDTTYDYTLSENQEYYDIQVRRYGSDYLENGVSDVTGEELYRFNGQEYMQVR